jgi:SAM-dependent methyltransferase
LGILSPASLQPTPEDLGRLFELKYGKPVVAGWGPRLRRRFCYFNPDDIYEAVVEKIVTSRSVWLDVGSGRDLFPSNIPLARELAGRCAHLVGVDPSQNIEENPFVHERARCSLQEYRTDRCFDVATMRMVAEHVTHPDAFVGTLGQLVRQGGVAVVYTVNRWSPVTWISSAVPHRLHHPVKRILWRAKEQDTFPVAYLMNTRRRLHSLFERARFEELHFDYLDDCRSFSRWRLTQAAELALWRSLRSVGLRYPETCLLGVYRRL